MRERLSSEIVSRPTEKGEIIHKPDLDQADNGQGAYTLARGNKVDIMPSPKTR